MTASNGPHHLHLVPSALTSFSFEGVDIHIVDVEGDPWWVVSPVASVLGYRDATHATRGLEADEKGLHKVETLGGTQSMVIVSEAGLYSMILRSRRPEAKRFRRWVTHDVLPSIRKTGRYSVHTPAREMPKSFAESLRMYADEVEAKEQALARLAIAEPKAAQADHHRAADGLISIGDFANKVKAWAKREHDAKVLHGEVWDFLGEIGLLIRGDTIRHNQPTAFASDRDFVRVKETEFETNNHGRRVGTSPRLTPAGEGWAWDRIFSRFKEFGALKKPSPQRTQLGEARPGE